MISIDVTVNNSLRTVVVPSNKMLVDMLRDDFLLLGCKIGCDQGVCGACTVLMDGRPVASCSTFAFEADNTTILTIEGLADEERLNPLQEAFLSASALQCGYCTPGIILNLKALLDSVSSKPDEALVRQWLSGSICRCTGYASIIRAVCHGK